jgi:hypothetical protein
MDLRKVVRLGKGLCPVVGLGMSGVEPSIIFPENLLVNRHKRDYSKLCHYHTIFLDVLQ